MRKVTLLFCTISFMLLASSSHASLFTSFEMKLLTVSSEGEQANEPACYVYVSPDGKLALFSSYASNLVTNVGNNELNLFIHNMNDSTTIRVTGASSQGIGNCLPRSFSISDDANFISFRSYVSNLVPNDNNNEGDIFVLDRSNGEIERMS